MPQPSLKPLIITAHDTYQALVKHRSSQYTHNLASVFASAASSVGLAERDTSADKANVLGTLAAKDYTAMADAKGEAAQFVIMVQDIEALKEHKLFTEGGNFKCIALILNRCALLAKNPEQDSLLVARAELDSLLEELGKTFPTKGHALQKQCALFLAAMEQFSREKIAVLLEDTASREKVQQLRIAELEALNRSQLAQQEQAQGSMAELETLNRSQKNQLAQQAQAAEMQTQLLEKESQAHKEEKDGLIRAIKAAKEALARTERMLADLKAEIEQKLAATKKAYEELVVLHSPNFIAQANELQSLQRQNQELRRQLKGGEEKKPPPVKDGYSSTRFPFASTRKPPPVAPNSTAARASAGMGQEPK